MGESCICLRSILDKISPRKCNRELCSEELVEEGRLAIENQDGRIELLRDEKEDWLQAFNLN
jgi:hypothetical protein